MRYQDYSGRTLAFLGDAVWSYVVRKHLLLKGEGKGKRLQKLSIEYVSAKAQASFYDALHEANFFTEEEEETFKRGRNDNTGTYPKNTPVQIYRKSTGFEAMIGMLDLQENETRINEIMEEVCKLKG